MTRFFTAVTGAACALASVVTVSQAQRGGMGRGAMMGMHADSATRAQMQVVHELVVNHDRIQRTVTNLPNGVRTVTSSDDARLAALIKTHVLTMNVRVDAGSDPGHPSESDALRTIFRNRHLITTSTDTTRTGVVFEQTSRDSATVAALQQHAAEVTELVNGGMEAMHAAVMRNGRGMMMPPKRDSTARR